MPQQFCASSGGKYAVNTGVFAKYLLPKLVQKGAAKRCNLDIGRSSQLAGKVSALLALFACLGLSACDWAKADPIAPKAAEVPEVLFSLFGELQQSATLVGKTEPMAHIDAAGISTTADASGMFVFGLDRDAPETAIISVTTIDGRTLSKTYHIEKREYRVSVVNGLPPATINPPPEAMAKIQRDSAIKQQAFHSQDTEMKGFATQFRWPLENVRVTSPWGAQRSLNGALQRPHYGIDLGGTTGTPILAPAQGKVVLAQSGMHFEGAMVGIDHGQGLITNYLHMSKIDVAVGQIVSAGDKIGEIGAEGRATGPHLCWRMRWRGRQLDPSKMVAPLQPAGMIGAAQ
ncbi:MAG: peptidase M23 [Hyphomonadaceae bacterium]|nr:MAG: peptidase M23 [Hyphomonadaceae bacterium]